MPQRLAPADRVRRLRERYGSHDKLAAALGTKRQTVIRWEKGSGISERYAVLLAEIDGCKPEMFRPPRGTQQFASLRQEVQGLAAEAQGLRQEVAEIRRAIEASGIALPGSP